MKPAEQFRKRHQELVDEFSRLSSRICEGNDEDFENLFQYVDREVLPHVRAEEELLYDRVDELTGTKLCTASMRRDHRDLERRAKALDDHQFPREFARRVNEFSTLFRHHLRKEEDVLMPFLCDKLETAELEGLLERMEHRETTYLGH